jgi:hypothetical protein
VRSNSPAAVLGWNSGTTRVRVVREELGELPGGEAKLMWGLAGLGCSGAAGPRVGDKSAGGLRMLLKRKAGDLGGACSGKAGEDHGGRCAASGAGRKKGKEKRALPSGAKWSERESAHGGGGRASGAELGCARGGGEGGPSGS